MLVKSCHGWLSIKMFRLIQKWEHDPLPSPNKGGVPPKAITSTRLPHPLTTTNRTDRTNWGNHGLVVPRDTRRRYWLRQGMLCTETGGRRRKELLKATAIPWSLPAYTETNKIINNPWSTHYLEPRSLGAYPPCTTTTTYSGIGNNAKVPLGKKHRRERQQIKGQHLRVIPRYHIHPRQMAFSQQTQLILELWMVTDTFRKGLREGKNTTQMDNTHV